MNILNNIKETILGKEAIEFKEDNSIVDKSIALGVLLYFVALSDAKFLPQEEKEIKDLLLKQKTVAEDNLSYVLAGIKEARDKSIDMYTFTHQLADGVSYNDKISILENLFRVACVDLDLDNSELEIIRKISGLFNISHKDFIETKIRVKKEFGLKVSEI